jgi:uncharacterized protein
LLNDERMYKRTVVDEVSNVGNPPVDVLEAGLLHKIMLLFHTPANWPTIVVVLFATLLAIVVGGFWFSVLQHALAGSVVIATLCLFMLVDGLILTSLPRHQLSFGPWKAQLFALAAPRLLVTMVLVVTAVWWGWKVGMSLVFVAQLIGVVALWHGAVREPFKLELNEYHMFSDRLPYGVPPIRILHLTDLHLERLTKREEKVLQFAANAKPDLIVITGDYVNLSYNRDPETLAQVKQFLSQLDAPFGVYATLGSPPVDLRETVTPLFDDLPIPLMRSSWVVVDMGDGRAVTLLGMDCTHHLPTDAERLANLVAAAPNSAPQVFLYHSPELMPQVADYGLDLYLCGHTHGGQVRLPIIGPLLTSSQLGRQFVMGIYRIGRTHLYVSRGIGLEGLSAPRVRFKAPPEVTLVIMHARGKPES